MTCYPKTSKAERVGHWLGKAYRALLRHEWRMRLWLVVHGLPATAAAVIAWSIRLIFLALLVSFSLLLLAVLVVMLFLIGRGVALSDLSYPVPETQWRDGHSGYGLYSRDGYRIDPHVFEDD
ncbi:DUF3742 family protein [Pseudomonas asplenii]|uniref:DUF3742 family protein n=1 Tax=Pseudomonas asplenii TaxID=53407 RepID=UPI0037CBF417